MKRALTIALAVIATTGVAVAAAGEPNDDDNDYEGRSAGQDTYFGFDLSGNGKQVKGITAYLHYLCEDDNEGNILLETDGSLKVEDDGTFSGKTTGESKLDVTYKTSGKIGSNGKAHGTIKAKGIIGGDTKCTSTNDGDWRAKEGRDIDVDTR